TTTSSGREGTVTGQLTVKPAAATPPLLADYEQQSISSAWSRARGWLDGLPGDRGLNIAHEAVDRHATGPLAGRTALRCLDRAGQVPELTYAQLKERTDRFAALLHSLGTGRGDRVGTLLGRSAELTVAALGTLKNASVYTPLSPALGPEPVRECLAR